MKIIDNIYCMSSFLAFRYVVDDNILFGGAEGGVERPLRTRRNSEESILCENADEIESALSDIFSSVDLSRAGIMLSGGIDSCILATYMPKGIKAYTANAPTGVAAIEIERARKVCDYLDLEHHLVDITWDGYIQCMDQLMLHDGCPVFANEPQVYIIAERMLRDGCNLVIFGDNADIAFGGYNLLLSKDWKYDEWIDRFTFIRPETVLSQYSNIYRHYEKFRRRNNEIDYLEFMEDIFAASSSGAYTNAFECLGIKYLDPYVYIKQKSAFDLERIRRGNSKYLLRELYCKRLPGFDIPEKIAMQRAVDKWLEDWNGPLRKEFYVKDLKLFSGEQKFQLFALERFLNIIEERGS